MSCDFHAIFCCFGELTPTQVKLKRDFATGVGKKVDLIKIFPYGSNFDEIFIFTITTEIHARSLANFDVNINK